MGIKIITENKKARFDYQIGEKFEAGIALKGSEIKSIRNQTPSIQEAYIAFMGDEVFLQKSKISPYQASSYNNHEPERLRKLLLNRSEINKILTGITEKGMACIPLKMYFKNGLIKLEIALGKGKNKGDKRQSIKRRDANREMERSLRHGKR